MHTATRKTLSPNVAMSFHSKILRLNFIPRLPTSGQKGTLFGSFTNRPLLQNFTYSTNMFPVHKFFSRFSTNSGSKIICWTSLIYDPLVVCYLNPSYIKIEFGPSLLVSHHPKKICYRSVNVCIMNWINSLFHNIFHNNI